MNRAETIGLLSTLVERRLDYLTSDCTGRIGCPAT